MWPIDLNDWIVYRGFQRMFHNLKGLPWFQILHILTKPPHKYSNLKFSKGDQRGSSGRLGKISLILQLIVYIIKYYFLFIWIAFRVDLKLLLMLWGWSDAFFSLCLNGGVFGIWKVTTGRCNLDFLWRFWNSRLI